MFFPREVGSMSAPKARCSGFDMQSAHILSFPLLPIQERQLSDTCKSCALSTG